MPVSIIILILALYVVINYLVKSTFWIFVVGLVNVWLGEPCLVLVSTHYGLTFLVSGMYSVLHPPI